MLLNERPFHNITTATQRKNAGSTILARKHFSGGISG